MIARLRFRSIEDAERGEQALAPAVPSYTVLPGGQLAVPEALLADAEDALNRAGLEFRVEPVEPYLGGRHIDEAGRMAEILEARALPWGGNGAAVLDSLSAAAMKDAAPIAIARKRNFLTYRISARRMAAIPAPNV